MNKKKKSAFVDEEGYFRLKYPSFFNFVTGKPDHVISQHKKQVDVYKVNMLVSIPKAR